MIPTATFLVKRMLKDYVAEYLAKECTIASHNMECGGFTRTRNPSTPIQLIAALNEYERMYGCTARKSFRCGQNFHNGHHQTDNGLSIQHQDKRESNQGFKKEKAITCYSCGTPGHKSTACPNVNTSANNSQFTESQKEDKKHLHRLSSTSSKLSNEVNGKIGPNKVSCILDSGSQISVVCEELVRPEQMREDMTTVSGFGSHEKNLPMADVRFHIQDMTFPLQVVVLTKEDMADMMLLGVNLGDDLFNLLRDIAKQSPKTVAVQVATTRNQANIEHNKSIQEACIMATEKPNPRNPSELAKGESGFVSSNGNENSQANSNTPSIDYVRESDGYVV